MNFMQDRKMYSTKSLITDLELAKLQLLFIKLSLYSIALMPVYVPE